MSMRPHRGGKIKQQQKPLQGEKNAKNSNTDQELPRPKEEEDKNTNNGLQAQDIKSSDRLKLNQRERNSPTEKMSHKLHSNTKQSDKHTDSQKNKQNIRVEEKSKTFQLPRKGMVLLSARMWYKKGSIDLFKANVNIWTSI